MNTWTNNDQHKEFNLKNKSQTIKQINKELYTNKHKRRASFAWSPWRAHLKTYVY